jgi:hypothetical protein
MSVKIDGTTYNVPVKKLGRKADFLDKYAERTEDGALKRELIGVYFNYSLEFAFTTDMTEYNRLWEKLTEPEEFHTVTVPTGNTTTTFTAYFSKISDQLVREDSNGVNYWQGLKVNFIAKVPART